MNVIPIKTKQHLNDILVIVLDRDDWLRMNQADPVQLSWGNMVSTMGIDVIQPTIVICYEPNTIKLMQFLQKRDIIGALKYLQRGVKPTDNPIQNAINRLGLSGHDY